MVKRVMSDKFIVFGKPDLGISESMAVQKVIESGWIGYGPVSRQFEREFGLFLGSKHCVAVSSCTIGLILALRTAGVQPGDKVLVPTLTFCATVNSVIQIGAIPVFYDQDQDISQEKAKAIIIVHLWGEKAKVRGVNTNMTIIEDCAHAFGGYVDGKPMGTIGNFGVFSFYPTKNITTGDGGMVVCKKQEDEDLIRMLSSQGLSKGAWNRYSDAPAEEYQVVHSGYKGLMTDLSAAIGISQLKRWPEIKEKRKEIFNFYEFNFGMKPAGHSQHIYEIRVKNRSKLRHEMYREGIGTGIQYNPLHLEPAYAYLGYKNGDFPKAEKIGRETLSLPLSSTMNLEDASRVVESIKKYGEITNEI